MNKCLWNIKKFKYKPYSKKVLCNSYNFLIFISLQLDGLNDKLNLLIDLQHENNN